MDLPTEEDLFELEHQEEFEALDDFDPTEFNDNYSFEPYSYGQKKINVDKALNEVNFDSGINEKCKSSINGESFKEDHIDSLQEDVNIILQKTPDTTHSVSKAQTNDNLKSSSKSSAKRKLLYHTDNKENVEFLESGENEFSHCEKRKASQFSDDEDFTTHSELSAKKRCVSEDPVQAFLRDKLQSQVRPSLFEESTLFSKETLTVTRSDGRRVYFVINDDDEEKNDVLCYSQKAGKLLTVPIDSLKTHYFILEEQAAQSTGVQLNECETMDTSEVIECEESALWVEKYKPESYMHLLSEEGINRTLLQWLKLWDKVVFGKEKKSKKKKVDPQKQTKFQKSWGELIEDLDEHGRPHHKVAFLCGPPGLGKTTLASIIAKQAGYNVVELNASDDRNPDAFRTNLEAATQMKSVLHQDHRPNCLVLDEIDGAPAASINVLLAFIKSVGLTKGKRKKGDIPLLMRPIICICNDQYSPALKPLRQISLVLNFPSTAIQRLASRLHEVSSKEGLAADMSALTLLCEKSSNDIRSCLSTLQFIHRKQDELKVSDVKGMQIGQKDTQKSLFAVWQDIFYYKVRKSFENIFSVIQAFGDYEKIYIGMFENYLNIKFRHRNIDSVWLGSEWNCFGDIIQQHIAQYQLYFLMPYLPYPAVAFHLLFSSNIYPQIAYPSAFYEYKAKSIQFTNTISSLVKEISSSLKTFVSSKMLLTDIFPFLLEIIKPNLRPVNTQLYSAREKNELRRVIELMLAFNLNYHQERALDGTYNYVLDPNIEELTKFSDSKAKKTLTYSTKQMIAREVEMEQMRKGDSTADKKAEKVKSVSSGIKVNDTKSVKKIEPERPVVDFFGRVITPCVKVKPEGEKNEQENEVWFHFKEGYSNAVRKTVYIKNLI